MAEPLCYESGVRYGRFSSFSDFAASVFPQPHELFRVSNLSRVENQTAANDNCQGIMNPPAENE